MVNWLFWSTPVVLFFVIRKNPFYSFYIFKPICEVAARNVTYFVNIMIYSYRFMLITVCGTYTCRQRYTQRYNLKVLLKSSMR